VKPEIIDGDTALLAEGVGPLSTMLVLLILPFRADAFFEKVIIGFESEF
jgi:hypothetical protein